tara:strand:- start:4462 stop:4770 length:309 start_codon:yes stop_codon:yes gene_type:complete
MAKKKQYNLKGKVYVWPGDHANWHFVTVDKISSTEIKENFGKNAKGFRSIPVTVTVGKTSWDTSVFPDSHSGCYLLPLKAQVRRKEGIWADEELEYKVKVRM